MKYVELLRDDCSRVYMDFIVNDEMRDYHPAHWYRMFSIPIWEDLYVQRCISLCLIEHGRQDR